MSSGNNRIMAALPSLKEIVWAIGAFLLVFGSIYFSREQRVQADHAIVVSDPQILFIHERTQVAALPQLLAPLAVSFKEEELLWAAEILRWRTLREGRYVLHGSYSYMEFLSKLARGEQTEMNVTIAPGQWEEVFITRVAAQLRFTDDDLRNAMNDSTLLADLGISREHIFGRMLPNTYRMFWTTTPEQFLRRMVREFDRAVTIPYQDRMTEMRRSVNDIVTMASIIEWESGFAEEKPKISGLYWNRIQRRWRLQADPTVNFALGERRRLVFEDYRIDHPYNTYQIWGLPPGPITNPSLASIRAALFPESHNYMYMVATPQGHHAFSRTYEEHQRRSREWTNWLREQRRIARMREQGLID